eukprot:g8117.t1
MFFGGSSGTFPKLYDGWFKKTAQIEKDMIAGAKSALRTGKPVEISFFPVPNIDEVQFGTALNKAFGTEVAKDLGMGEYKPGSTIKTYLVQYSNVYWAKKLADGLGGTCWVATSDGLKKDPSVIKKPGKAKFCSLRKAETLEGIKKGDTVIVVAPGVRAEWASCEQRFKDNKLIFLNAPLSETYDLGGPLKGLEQGYYLKRISKGYVFRISPKPWEALLEKPEGGLEILGKYDDKPLLRDVAKVVRSESMQRFGIDRQEQQTLRAASSNWFAQFWRTNITDKNGDTLEAAKEKLKERLLMLVRCTERGISTSEEQRQDIDELIAALEPFNPNAKSVTSESLSALWVLEWTTEQEILFLMEKGLPWKPSGPVQQEIDVNAKTLSNKMIFGDDSLFEVFSSIDPDPSGPRVNFEFEACKLTYGGFTLPLPPVGKGWFESVYLDHDLRVTRDVRGDVTVLVKSQDQD